MKTATAESERAFAELCSNPSADPPTRRLLAVGFDAKGLLGDGVQVEEARALAFVTLVVANSVLILSCRSAHSGWKDMVVGFSSVGAWVITGTLIGLTITTLMPAIAGVFIFVPPAVSMWLAAFVCSVATCLTRTPAHYRTVAFLFQSGRQQQTLS